MGRLQGKESTNFGGVDSRSNPVNLPDQRFLIMRNWIARPDGHMELRDGYTVLPMTPVQAAVPIHSAYPYQSLLAAVTGATVTRTTIASTLAAGNYYVLLVKETVSGLVAMSKEYGPIAVDSTHGFTVASIPQDADVLAWRVYYGIGPGGENQYVRQTYATVQAAGWTILVNTGVGIIPNTVTVAISPTTAALGSAADAFSGSGALSSNWTTVNVDITGIGGTSQYAGAFGPSGTNGDYWSFWNANGFANDQYSEFTLTALGVSDSTVGLVVRAKTDGSLNGYLLRIGRSAGVAFRDLSKVVAGVYTTLASDGVAGSPGHVYKLSAVGTTITVLVNGVALWTVTDSALASGSPGISSYLNTDTSARGTSWIGHPTISTQQFVATVSNAPVLSVTWTATDGTVSPSGLYTASGTPGTYAVTATSVADPTVSASAVVTVT